MALYLIELAIEASDRSTVEAAISTVSQAASRNGGELVESQVTGDLKRVYAIMEAEACADFVLPVDSLVGVRIAGGPDEVRLVGAEIEDIKKLRSNAGFLVEWDIPAEITMDQYLARKKERSPRYAQVPEVAFLRTYVREDTSKCLCFYDGPSEDAIRHAREVVETPVSRLFALGSVDEVPNL